VVFASRPGADLPALLAEDRVEIRPLQRPLFIGRDEVAVVLAEEANFRDLSGPPPTSFAESADRVGVVTLADREVALHEFWSARVFFSLPAGAGARHVARAARSLFRFLEDRTVSDRSRRALADRTREIRALVDVGVALSAERDRDHLLETILTRARALTSAEGGSLYLLEDSPGGRVLKFVRAQNDSVRFDFVERTLPLASASIAGFVALSGRALNLPDVSAIPPDAPYQFDPGFDRQYGYRSKSMLTVPMSTPEGKTIGVLQLLNRRRSSLPEVGDTAFMRSEVVPFEEENEEVAKALAAQAAVAVENRKLTENIRRLFEGFVEASVTAIEQRDPTTSGHSERVALLACGLAQLVDRTDSGPFAAVRIPREELRELRYAAVLHDFGKVGVREEVLVKARKLPPRIATLVRSRVDQAVLSAAAEVWEKAAREKWTERQVAQALGERVAILERAWKVVSTADEPSLLAAEIGAEIGRLSDLQYRDATGHLVPVVLPEEIAYLSIPKGSLTERERREIESHVTQTFRFLSKIPWTDDLSRVPDWAYAHHEKLDGSGYPRKLAADAIPIAVRAITISDIYDALAARDRPYKRAVPNERALEILRSEAKRGAIDAQLLELFIGERVYIHALAAPSPD